MSSSYLCFNPTIQVHEFDGATQRPMLVCEVPTGDPNASARYLLPVEIVEFLQQFDGAQEPDALIQRYAATQPQHTPEKLASLVYKYCVQKRLLVDPGVELEPLPKSSKAARYLYLKVGLLPPKVVAALSTPLTWLFRWDIMLALLPIFIASQAYFFLAIMPRYHFSLNALQGFDFFMITLITSFLGLFHELGHTAALNRFGHRRSEIGWGLYISFAVFYADLSDAWRLKRMQRAMVDLGGIYFHCICLLFLLGLIQWTGNRLLVYSFFFIELQIAGCLNPFLRMDGYWLVGDLFGIADLNKRTMRVIEHIVYRLLGIRRSDENPFGELNRKSRVFLFVYIMCGMAFVGFIFKIIVVQIAFEVLPAYPKLLLTAWTMLRTDPRNVLGLLDIASGILWKGLAIYGFLLFVYRTMLTLCLWVMRTVQAAVAQQSRTRAAAEGLR